MVGGGPAGMFLGLLLARAGVPVTVLEKHADFLRDFRGDTVHPQTLALLEDLGLAERFARIADRRMYGMRMRFGEHHVTAAEEPCCTLLMETRVTGPLRERDGRVRGVRYTDRPVPSTSSRPS